jgi:GT2 family glycosyltransferase
MGVLVVLLSEVLQAVLILGLITLALLSLYLALLTALRWLAPPRPRCCVLPADDALPTVLVQLPLYNEGTLVERLLAHVTAFDWPRDRLLIQVLDDSTDGSDAASREAAEALQRSGWPVSLWHRTRRSGFKAGALAAGLRHTDAPFVAIFDADFMPPPDFLRRTLGVLLADPALGYVQARWTHANQDISTLTRAQARLLDGHFRVEQEVRHRLGLPVPFNGTCGVWRRAAIDGAGGWSGDTLTEDLDLSLRACLAGWRSAYVADLAVPGELPETARSWRAQQFRWNKGFVECLVKLAPRVWRSRLPGWQKLLITLQLSQPLSFLVGCVCLLAGLPFIAGLVPGPLLTQAALVTASIGMVGPFCLLLAGGLAARPKRPTRALLHEAVLAFVLSTGLLLSNGRGGLEALLGVRSPFVRTPKASTAPGRRGAAEKAFLWSPSRFVRSATAGLVELGAGGALLLFVLFERPLALPALALAISGLVVLGAFLWREGAASAGVQARELGAALQRVTQPFSPPIVLPLPVTLGNGQAPLAVEPPWAAIAAGPQSGRDPAAAEAGLAPAQEPAGRGFSAGSRAR